MANKPIAKVPTTVPTSHKGIRPVVPVLDINKIKVSRFIIKTLYLRILTMVLLDEQYQRAAQHLYCITNKFLSMKYLKMMCSYDFISSKQSSKELGFAKLKRDF